MALWALRKRKPVQSVTGANFRIALGAFGNGSPLYAIATPDTSSDNAWYRYHEGDLFTPGAGNVVFEPNFELPLQTIWGQGFTRMPNTFNPVQPPQVYVTAPTQQANGIGGPQAGQLELQGLIDPATYGG
jgi:hypothetical protein